jgi:hypothetical protein
MYQWIALAAALIGSGADTAPLTPSTKWIVDYQQEGCLLTRTFGPATAPTALGFEPSMARDVGRLIVVLPNKGIADRQGTAHITLQPSGATLTLKFDSGVLKTERRGITMWVEPGDVASLTEAQTIVLDVGEAAPIALQTGGMGGALRAIRACQDDLLKGWGVDRANQLPDADVPNLANLFFGSYPQEAMEQHARGRTIALVFIGNDGRGVSCRTVVSAGNAALDKEACWRVAHDGRFPPAERDPALPPRWVLVPVKWILYG